MRALRRTHPGWFELSIFALAYLTYFGVRALTEGSVSTAVANALDLVHVEPGLGNEVVAALEAQGLDVREWPERHHYFGGVSVVARTGVAGDPRRSGSAAAVPR